MPCFFVFLLYDYNKMPYADPQGPQAARIRQRKFELLRRHPIPAGYDQHFAAVSVVGAGGERPGRALR